MKRISIDKIPNIIYNENISPKRVLLGLHGLYGSKESSTLQELAQNLEDRGCVVICVDLPRHGEYSDCPLTLPNVMNTIEAEIKYIKNAYPDAPLDLFATSFGAYSALLYLTKHDNPFDKIFLRCPAVNMSDIDDEDIEGGDNGDANEREEDSYKTFKLTKEFVAQLKENDLFFRPPVTYPVTVIQGDVDDVVPFDKVKKYIDEKLPNADLRVIKGADHIFKRPQDMTDIITIVRG